MSPLQIEILLHYWSRTSDRDDLHFPAQQEAVEWFKEEDLLRPRAPDGRGSATLALTGRGEAYLAELCHMPLPLK